MRDELEIISDATGLRVGIVVSGYHRQITASLKDAAIARFCDAGGDESNLFIVPAAGTFELTAVCRAMAERQPIDAIVAIGCVISGETDHDRYLCESVVNGLTSIIVRTGIPIAFGVLTCRNMEQAEARAGGAVGNKGTEAMTAAIETATTIRTLRQSPRTAEI